MAKQNSTQPSRKLPGADTVVYFEHKSLLEHEKDVLAKHAQVGKAFKEREAQLRDLIAKTATKVKENRLKSSKEKRTGGEKSPMVDKPRNLVDRSEPELHGMTPAGAQPHNHKQTDKKAFSDTPPIESGGYLDDGVFPTCGLALSGGGIRSAAFCTGALQGLANHNVYGLVDYLSTVSGGGYLGSLLTLNQNAGNGFVLLGPAGEKKDTDAMKQLRDNANYLRFGSPMQMLRNFAIYLRGLVANIVILAAVLFFLAAITLFANGTYDSLLKPDIFGITLPHWWSSLGVLAVSAMICIVILVLNVLWANAVSFRKGADAGMGSKLLWLAALAPLVLSLVFFLELQPLLVHKMIGDPIVGVANSNCAIDTLQAQCTGATGQVLPFGQNCAMEKLSFSCVKPPAQTAGVNFTPGLQRLVNFCKAILAPFLAIVTLLSTSLGEFFRQEEVKNTWTSLLKRNTSRLLVFLTAAAFLISLWVMYLLLVYWGVDLGVKNNLPPRSVPVAMQFVIEYWQLFTAGTANVATLYLIVSVVLYFLIANLQPNANSLHRLYRDRLGVAFCYKMQGDTAIALGNQKLSTLAECRPIHLFNTAVNLQRSPVVKRSGRKADFFLFSPLWTGSEATGYGPTSEIEKLSGAKDLDIATVVAVSGAAVSSNMGSQSMRPLAPLLASLNVRLGFWFPNPRLLKDNSGLRPNLWYFLSEILGRMDEDRNTIYLTDGGHVENLGIYELLRRRCRLIIAVDAEADADMNFKSFVTLQRYARIDLGARIDLNWSSIASTTLKSMAEPTLRANGPHCAVGTIEYDNGGIGYLVYIKLSVTGDENDYVRDYNQRNASFPHESTGDQRFSEEQFEAYRALGFHAVNGMLEGKQKIQSSAEKLEFLIDINATGDGVKEVALLLGLTPQSYVVPMTSPETHRIKIVN
jgi:predicted acylesterase/phospholipase RssA